MTAAKTNSLMPMAVFVRQSTSVAYNLKLAFDTFKYASA